MYFTLAYDVINDGWLSLVVRSPVFLQMNHRHIRDYLSEEVLHVYDQHFSLRRTLYPATMQEYLGNLFYLLFHQVTHQSGAQPLRVPTYEFNGKLPEYDESKNVWKTKLAPDRFNQSRWLVREPEESVNLKDSHRSWLFFETVLLLFYSWCARQPQILRIPWVGYVRVGPQLQGHSKQDSEPGQRREHLFP